MLGPIRQEPARLDKWSNRGLFRLWKERFSKRRFVFIGYLPLQVASVAVPSLIRAPASPASGGGRFLRVALFFNSLGHPGGPPLFRPLPSAPCLAPSSSTVVACVGNAA